jgi:DNA mismatch repair protein MutS2
VREMEKKLESVLRDFEYHAREAVNAIQDKAAPKKPRKTPSAASPNCAANFASSSIPPSWPTPAEPTRAIRTPSRNSETGFGEGDTVKLKSTGRAARVSRKIDDDHFEVEMGAMKMKVARDDMAEVLTSAPPARERLILQ